MKTTNHVCIKNFLIIWILRAKNYTILSVYFTDLSKLLEHNHHLIPVLEYFLQYPKKSMHALFQSNIILPYIPITDLFSVIMDWYLQEFYRNGSHTLHTLLYVCSVYLLWDLFTLLYQQCILFYCRVLSYHEYILYPFFYWWTPGFLSLLAILPKKASINICL